MPAFALALLLITQDYQAANEHLERALAAKEKKDHESYLDHLEQAVRHGVDHPLVLYRLAAAHALVGHERDALAVLHRIADLGIAFEPDKDPDFMGSKLDLTEINARFAKNLTPTAKSRVAFVLPEEYGMAEGVAYDPAGRRFLIGTVSTQKILSIDDKGRFKEIASDKDGLWSVLGMAVDRPRNALWAATSAVDEKRRAALVKLDLGTGRVMKKLLLPEDGKEHVLGDVIVTSKGDAYTTDSITPGIHRVSRDGDGLELFLSSSAFGSLQGLCLSADEKKLFVADYSRGVFVVDMAGKKSQRLSVPPRATVVGIDGLYCHRGSLIATQNGVRPNRILRLELDPSRKRIERVTVLESNHSDFTEVTLGAIVGDALFYVAAPTKILRLPL